jgi:transposase-like protein
MTESKGGALFSGPRKTRSYEPELKKKILDRVQAGESVPAICRDLGIESIGTVYGWINGHRRKSGTSASVGKKSRRPHHQPKLTSQWIVDKILKIKKEKPEMGAKAMSDHLLRFESVNLSHSTVGKIFKKHEIVDGDKGAAEARYRTKGDDGKQFEQQVEKEMGEWERFCRPHPNDLWQMDIMGFYIRDAHKVYLISAIDDCSRMIVGWGLFRISTGSLWINI